MSGDRERWSAAGGGSSGSDGRGGASRSEGYRAALEGAAYLVRGDVRRLKVSGRAPRRMLQGMVSGRIPPPLVPDEAGRWTGRAEPSALLDVKGRMVGWLRLSPLPAEPLDPPADPPASGARARPASDEGDLLIEVPEPAFVGVLEQLRRSLPPRFASFEDVSASTALVSLLGPEGPSLLSRLGPGAPSPDRLHALAEGDLLVLTAGGGAPLTVVRSGEVAAPAWDLTTGAGEAAALIEGLAGAGALPADASTWDVLRLEAGRPAYGSDMDASTLPVEAGVHRRAVDYAKGCFTGQEVLIRIRDRGHVNRHLRGLRMGSLETLPEGGTELVRADDGKAVGRVTSSGRSPRFGEVVGLGYVRREVEPPAVLRLGDRSGPPVGVHDLDEDWSP